ncbi:hypothetical protein ACJX0J_018501, partial [Zea mays]
EISELKIYFRYAFTLGSRIFYVSLEGVVKLGLKSHKKEEVSLMLEPIFFPKLGEENSERTQGTTDNIFIGFIAHSSGDYLKINLLQENTSTLPKTCLLDFFRDRRESLKNLNSSVEAWIGPRNSKKIIALLRIEILTETILFNGLVCKMQR